jgi:predicted MFS family arabinose efflux permease
MQADNKTGLRHFSFRDTFRSLRNRDFRLLWCGLLVSAIGTWMQIIALSLVVLRITNNSAGALGLVSLVQAAAFFLFAPVGGGLADRFERRNVLMVCQVLLMLIASTLGVLTSHGKPQLTVILLLAFLSSLVTSVDQPTRYAMISTLVPPDELMNALALQSFVFNGASLLGPALAGIVANSLGLAADFYLNAVSFGAVLVSLFALRAPAGHKGRSGNILSSFRQGFSAMRADAVLPALICAYGVLLFLGPSPAILLPLFATKVAALSAKTLGILFAAVGFGTLIGALGLASLGDFRYKGRLIFGGFLLWSVALSSFAASRGLAYWLVSLVLLGIAQNMITGATITLMQARVDPVLRGRMMALNTMLMMGVRPIGDFGAGMLMGAAGVRFVTIAAAIAVGAVAVTIFASRPRLFSA